MPRKLLGSVGVVADVQHSTTPGLDAEEYVGCLARLDAAAAAWRQQRVVAVAQLGDIIDGGATPTQSTADTQAVLSRFAGGRTPTDPDTTPAPKLLHVVGNHCLVNQPRPTLARLLFGEASAAAAAAAAPDAFYRAERIAELPGWRLLLLDTMEVSTSPAEGAAEGEAAAVLAKRPLGSSPEMQSWNGGVSRAQLRWLEEQVADAAAAGERCVVLCHHPLLDGGAAGEHLCWSHAEVRGVLEAHPGVVPLVLTGHLHIGQVAQSGGVTHVTLKAMLTEVAANSFAVLRFYDDGSLHLDGCGTAQPDVIVPAAAPLAQPPATNVQ